MTRSWRASWRWHWCAPAGGGGAAGCWPAPAPCRRTAEAGFGFALTGSQRQALAEIAGDMKAPHRMMRLLQGDVGSGKTVVALLAMLIAVESGGQAALMAPTEMLARQHHQVLQRLAAPAGVEIGLLTGREKGRARDSMLASLASGLTPVVVGTHALVQPDVAFRDLALAVIDEQHRFGVEQRLALGAKGNDADTLLMSATPIPRTLMLTAYGDLDISRLVDKPPGRQPVDTRTVPLDRAEEVTGAIARALKRGAKVFWVCPMVEESENADIAAAEERYRALAELLPGRVGLVHGRMKSADKDRAMAGFAATVGSGGRPAGRDDGDRGRHRRAGRHRHGDRARRALRPGAIAPAARPHRPRRPALDLPAAVPAAARRGRAAAPGDPARDRGRLPHRRGGSAAARRRRGARHPAERPAGTAPRRPGAARGAGRGGARRRPSRAGARPRACRARAARRCACCCTCSAATRRCSTSARDEPAHGGVQPHCVSPATTSSTQPAKRPPKVPAKAGTHRWSTVRGAEKWIPACAGIKIERAERGPFAAIAAGVAAWPPARSGRITSGRRRRCRSPTRRRRAGSRRGRPMRSTAAPGGRCSAIRCSTGSNARSTSRTRT